MTEVDSLDVSDVRQLASSLLIIPQGVFVVLRLLPHSDARVEARALHDESNPLPLAGDGVAGPLPTADHTLVLSWHNLHRVVNRYCYPERRISVAASPGAAEGAIVVRHGEGGLTTLCEAREG